MFYTVDGSPANTSSSTYTGAITIASTTTLHAIASINGVASSQATATYTIAPPPVVNAQPIKHVVVIFGENVSFDHYFATYPVAANPPGQPAFNAAPGTPAVEGLSGALLTANPNSTNSANGAGAVNPFRLDRAQAATADQDHDYQAEQIAFDHGLMDLFPMALGAPDSDSLSNSTTAPPIAASNGLTMGYFDGNTVTALWNYAQQYALNDHSFGTTFGPSTSGAINLVSGQTNGVVNDYGAESAVLSDGSSSGFTLIGDADPAGDLCSSSSAGIHMKGKSIGDLLTAAKIPWGFFEGGFDLTRRNADGSTGCSRSTTSQVTNMRSRDYVPHHQPFQYYASTANPNHLRPASVAAIGTEGDGANHQYDMHDFTDALAAGNMPAVSFLKAPAFQDGHAGYSDPLDEQAFLVSTINTIQQSPFWSSTAIILAWDDSDGWYDHLFYIVNGSQSGQDALLGPGVCGGPSVSPSSALAGVDGSPLHAQGRCGYGPRLPLLVVSPWAKKNMVDSTVTDQTSITRFIEDTFLSGQRLPAGSFDSIAGPLTNMFDFNNSSGPNAGVLVLDPQTGVVVH
jgi:phospholipase C